MDFWQNLLAAVALAMAVTCFTLFVLDAIRAKPSAEEIARQAVAAARDPDVDSVVVDPTLVATFVKSIADALSKVGPGLVALIGALLFFLLSGMAVGVYTLANTPTVAPATAANDAPADDAAKK